MSQWVAVTRFSLDLSVLNHIVSGPRFPINATPEGFGIPHMTEHGTAIPSLNVTEDIIRCSATFQIIISRSSLALTIISASYGHQAIAVIVFLCSDWIECNRYSRETASHCNKGSHNYHNLINSYCDHSSKVHSKKCPQSCTINKINSLKT